MIAGVNGAGKSSVVGEALRQRGADYHNPDELTRAYLDRGLGLDEANSRAWQRGRQALIRAVDDGLDFALETTLGGRTMTDLLVRAARQNLIRLLPHLSELRVFDNSLEADPQQGALPSPRLLLAMRDGQIVHSVPLDDVPDWAKPVMMAAAKL